MDGFDGEEMPFTDDSDEDQEYLGSDVGYEKWKFREILRVKRDRDERTKFLQEKNEILRRRAMTEEERQAEDEKLGADHNSKKQQVAYNFMQKYYHKGAFYQQDSDEQDEDLKNRDFNMPTLEDKADRSALPSLLQKRMGTFGRRAQSKWTHLTNEDTTNFDPATRVAESIAAKRLQKQGGYKGQNDLERPAKKRKL